MSGFKAYYNFTGNEEVGSSINLDSFESRHLCGSLRAKLDDELTVFDLNANIFNASITNASTKSTSIKLNQKLTIKSKSTKIYLAQALPKGKAFDEIIRQSIEIGIAGIIPIISKNSVIKLDKNEAILKHSKWQQQIIEAIKQSSNFSSFELLPIQSFDNFISADIGFDLKMIASLQNPQNSIKKLLENQTPKSVCILIGPEGDFNNDEYKKASEAYFNPVSLGENVLRSNTAAIFSLSAISAILGLQ